MSCWRRGSFDYLEGNESVQIKMVEKNPILVAALNYYNLPLDRETLVEIYQEQRRPDGSHLDTFASLFLRIYLDITPAYNVDTTLYGVLGERIYGIDRDSGFEWIIIDNDNPAVTNPAVRNIIYQQRLQRGMYRCGLDGQCHPTDDEGLSLVECQSQCRVEERGLILDNLYEVYAYAPELALDLPIVDQSRVVREIVGYTVPDYDVRLALHSLASGDWGEMRMVRGLAQYFVDRYGVLGVIARDLAYSFGLHLDNFDLEVVISKMERIVVATDFSAMCGPGRTCVLIRSSEKYRLAEELAKVFYHVPSDVQIAAALGVAGTRTGRLWAEKERLLGIRER